MQHRIGMKTFMRKYNVDLPEWAAEYEARYLRESSEAG